MKINTKYVSAACNRSHLTPHANVQVSEYNAREIAKVKLPQQLDKLEQELQLEQNSEYPDLKRIERIKSIIENLKKTIQRCQSKTR